MDGLDGCDWKSPGGVKYRAAYAANSTGLSPLKKESSDCDEKNNNDNKSKDVVEFI